MTPRLVPAPLEIAFSPVEAAQEDFEREFQKLSDADDDPIGQWLKLAKARGETKETDPVLLYLVVELHRKVDQLTQLVKNERPERVALARNGRIEAVGYEHFQLETPMLIPGERYYGRIDMPLFPRRDMGVWFRAETDRLARIERVHERDEKEWSGYVAARERILIREMKGKQGD
jgi:hypothetical protein